MNTSKSVTILPTGSGLPGENVYGQNRDVVLHSPAAKTSSATASITGAEYTLALSGPSDTSSLLLFVYGLNIVTNLVALKCGYKLFIQNSSNQVQLHVVM